MSHVEPESETEPKSAPAIEEVEATDVVETCTIAGDIVIHAAHPFGNVTYIDVTSERGTVDTQIRVKEVTLNGAELGGLDRALHLDDCRIELDAEQTYAAISI